MVVAADVEQRRHWMPDPRVEATLSDLGATWEYYRDVNINLIDVNESKNNQARIGSPILLHLVDDYATSMENGAVFPALVGFARGDGSFYLADGNNRLPAAKRAGIAAIDLYVVQSNDAYVRNLVILKLNRLNGARPPREHTIQQILTLVKTYGKEVHEVARDLDVSVSSVNTEIRRDTTRKRLYNTQIRPEALSMASLDALHRVTTDAGLRAAAELLVAAKLPESDVRRLAQEVGEQHSEAGQQAVVDQWKNRDDIKLRLKPGRPAPRQTRSDRNRTELFRMLTRATTLVKKYGTRGALGLTNDDDMAKAVTLGYALVEGLEHAQAGTPA